VNAFSYALPRTSAANPAPGTASRRIGILRARGVAIVTTAVRRVRRPDIKQ
jgi:hypothetical protein